MIRNVPLTKPGLLKQAQVGYLKFPDLGIKTANTEFSNQKTQKLISFRQSVSKTFQCLTGAIAGNTQPKRMILIRQKEKLLT